MTVTPNISLSFDGHCEAAFRCYEQCLGGTLGFMLTWGESPMAADAPPGWEAKIFHATLKVGDSVIQGGDPGPERYARPAGFSMVLQMNDPATAERVFEALAEHGRIDMPLQSTFWARRFAAFVDRFGIPWTINCE
jgi:PhnB protein